MEIIRDFQFPEETLSLRMLELLDRSVKNGVITRDGANYLRLGLDKAKKV